MKKLLILTFFTVCTFILMVTTYGIFESGVLQGASIRIAAWNVTVNDSIITNEDRKFNIDNIIWNGSKNVKDGKVAPGMDGYFDIVIDPKNTDVSIRYDLVYDMDYLKSINTAFMVTGIEEIGGNKLVLTDKYTYTGIIDLNSFEKQIIRTYIKWEDLEKNGEVDYTIGKMNTEFELPINLNISQYLGEEILEVKSEE